MKRQVLPLALAALGVIVAGLVAAMPQDSLDLLMWRLWLPHILSAATPPIGVTGRTLLAIASMLPFIGAAAASWLLRERKLSVPVRRRSPQRTEPEVLAPVLRRADAHPDAPPRRPIRASEDLGPPLPIVTVSVTRGVPEPEQPLPRNLDQPLAAFDPISVPDVPREPVRAVAPLAPPPPPAPEAATVVDFAWPVEPEAEEPPVLPFLALAPDPEPAAPPPPIIAAPAIGAPLAAPPVADAFEAPQAAGQTMSPMPAHDPITAATTRKTIATATAPQPEQLRTAAETDEPAADGSLASLLDRLERGARRKKAPAPAPEPAPAASLDDTLVMLRRLAAG